METFFCTRQHQAVRQVSSAFRMNLHCGIDRQMDGQTDGQTDPPIDGWMDGQTDGWMDFVGCA